ncbi:unnamed protein product, partial [Prunus brigantina]
AQPVGFLVRRTHTEHKKTSATYLTTAPPEKQCLSLLRRSCPKLRFKPGYIFGYPGPITTRRQYAFSTSTGLYGFDHLKTPKGFRRFVDDAIERSGELVAYISGMPSSAEIIRAMDEISNTVCSVIDSAELCRQTHPDSFRCFGISLSIKASIRVNEYLHYLNTNHTLYNAVIKAEQEGNLLTDEAHRAAHYLHLDFERSGIHLSAEKVDRVNRLSIEISHLCRQFNQNIVNDPGTVDIFPASHMPRNLHHLLKPIYRSTSVVSKDSWRPRGTMNEKGFRITTDPHTLSCVLQGAPNDEFQVRKMTYIKGNSVPHANLGVLDQLIASRHEFA